MENTTKAYNTRWLAFCRAEGYLPSILDAAGRGPVAGEFMGWIAREAAEFRRDWKLPEGEPVGHLQYFDDWLEARHPKSFECVASHTDGPRWYNIRATVPEEPDEMVARGSVSTTHALAAAQLWLRPDGSTGMGRWLRPGGRCAEDVAAEVSDETLLAIRETFRRLASRLVANHASGLNRKPALPEGAVQRPHLPYTALPEDMQVLLYEWCGSEDGRISFEDALELMEFPLVRVRPVADHQIGDLDPDRGNGHVNRMLARLSEGWVPPPVLVSSGRLVDGFHRMKMANVAGLEFLWGIDVSAALQPSAAVRFPDVEIIPDEKQGA